MFYKVFEMPKGEVRRDLLLRIVLLRVCSLFNDSLSVGYVHCEDIIKSCGR